jgi:inosine-uridine nucleoside N-ribohydrolase
VAGIAAEHDLPFLVISAGTRNHFTLDLGLDLPAWPGPQPSESAVHLLTDTINGSARPVELITLGPFTDIALALRADPGIAHKIAMIYAMAGAVRVNGNEPKYANAEWNVYVDAVAADRVLRSGIPMTFVPLDASGNVPVTTFFQQTVQAPRRPDGTPTGQPQRRAL